MSDTNPNELPLDINLDLSSVTTTLPLLPETFLLFKVKHIARVPGKEPNKTNLKVDFILDQPGVTDANGKPVNPGFPMSSYFPLQAWQRKDGTVDDTGYLEGLSRLLDACLGTGDAGNAKGKPPRPDLKTGVPQCIGKQVLIKNKHDSFNGMPTNSVNRLSYPGDAKA